MINTHSASRVTWRLRFALVSALISLWLLVPGSSVAIEFGSIGDTVFRDSNGNGVQDGLEPGIQGVFIRLRRGSSTSTYRLDQTDANGKYRFDPLLAGDYVVVVDDIFGELDGLSSTTGGDSRSITLGDGETNLDVDFGYGEPGVIGDTVFQDDNGNGVQDGGEPGIAGVTVVLQDSSNNPLATVVTDGNGNYLFDGGLAAGDYIVDVDESSGPLTGLVPSTPEPRDVTLGSNETNLDVDFGYWEPPNGEINGTVFEDDSLDGAQGAGEPGIAGVTVVVMVFDGGSIATTITDGNGNYGFLGLPPGEYFLDADDASSALDGLGPTTVEPRAITLAAGEVRSGVDFGYDENAEVDLAPNLTLQEKSAFAVIEQGLSLLGAVIARQGCEATAGVYTFDGAVNSTAVHRRPSTI